VKCVVITGVSARPAMHQSYSTYKVVRKFFTSNCTLSIHRTDATVHDKLKRISAKGSQSLRESTVKILAAIMLQPSKLRHV